MTGNSKYIILADLTCDLNEEIRKEFNVEDYIKGHVTISDGRDLPTLLDWSAISREDFYTALSDKKIQITTAAANIDEYYSVFEGYVKQGYSILSMSISSKISGTYNFACTAAERIRESYPEADIYCFDAFRMSGAFGLLVLYAHYLKNNGSTLSEVIAWLEENKNRVHQMGPIDDLMYVARRGRISMTKAIMGSFAGVKPMGDCNSDGYTTVLTKVKGIPKALDITAKYVKETAQDAENSYMLIAHSNREGYANALKEMLEAEVAPKKVFVTDVFSGCGANIGPGMVGVYYLGAPISDELEAEKAVIEHILGK